MKKALIIIVVLVILGGGVYLLVKKDKKDSTPATTSTSTTTSNTSTSTGTEASTSSSISITDFNFSPAATTVKVGTKVTWTNNDTAGHTVTADTASADAPSSKTLNKGETYSFTFTKAGTYAYHCEIHPDMKATVTVTE